MRILVLLFFAAIFAFAFNLKSLFTYTFDANKNYDLELANKIYHQNKCHTCHGESGELIVERKALKDMKPEDIKGAMINYQNASNSNLMNFHSMNLSHDDIDLIIAYIKGGDFALDLEIENLKEEEPEKKTKHGTFIK